jgi:hypothetical protein
MSDGMSAGANIVFVPAFSLRALNAPGLINPQWLKKAKTDSFKRVSPWHKCGNNAA